jgi:hypothetical protein
MARKSYKKNKNKKTRKTLKRNHKRIRTRRNRRVLRGGNYTEFTNKEINGIPVTKNALITTDDGTFSPKEFINHKEYQDFHGVGIDDDY